MISFLVASWKVKARSQQCIRRANVKYRRLSRETWKTNTKKSRGGLERKQALLSQLVEDRKTRHDASRGCLKVIEFRLLKPVMQSNFTGFRLALSSAPLEVQQTEGTWVCVFRRVNQLEMGHNQARESSVRRELSFHALRCKATTFRLSKQASRRVQATRVQPELENISRTIHPTW